MIIYKTTNNVNGKIYIGQDYYNNPKYFGSGLIIQRAIKKYGIDSFKKEILERCKTQEELNEREIYWIAFYNSCDKKIGYNISHGGQGGYLCKNCPEKLRGENYYLNKLSEKDREIHLNTYRRGVNYWKSKGFKTIEEIEKYIENNYKGKNHSHRKGKTEEEYQEWLNKNRRGKNNFLNRKLTKSEREKYLDNHYRGRNNPTSKNKTEEEYQEWLNENRRGKNSTSAKYVYTIITADGEIIKTDCLKTLCEDQGYNLHVLRKFIEVSEGKRKDFIPRKKEYLNWKVYKEQKVNK
jgi:hypothetical protein